METKKSEVAPPGWEGTVKAMKAHPEITNPWALAWYMSDKGDTSHKEDGDGEDMGLALIRKWEDFEKTPEYKDYSEKYGEANSASSAGQLFKPKKPVESKRVDLTFGVRFLENGDNPNDVTREVPVLIIKEGMGNKADRHFYTADLLKRVAPMFDGVKAYANHPSKTEETDRPERDIRDIVGFYHSPEIVMLEGKAALKAVLKINAGAAYDWAWSLVKEASAYARKFKDKDLVGISINAWGASHQVEAADGIVNMVDDLTEVQSADIVTQAGAGGGFRLREAVKKVLAREGKSKKEGKPMYEGMKDDLAKHGQALAALHDQIKKDPAHEKSYGGAMEALMAHHAEMMKGCESEAGAPAGGGAPPSEPPVEEKKEAERRAAEMADFEKMTEAYKAGKMTPVEKKIYEALATKIAEGKVKENAEMVARHLRESGIPEAFTEDLAILCAGKPEADVKKLVEARKKLVAPLIGDKGTGAGAGGGSKTPSKLAEKLAGAGVKMVEVKK